MHRVLAILLVLAAPLLAAEPFEIKNGDRVVLLGDALLEREDTYGYLETRMHEQFPDRSFTVRNISWAGDTPRGWSRASFDPAEKGMDRLREAIELTRPTVVFLGYGMAASLQEMTDRAQDPTLNPDPARYGREPMSAARFKRELGELMTLIEETTRATQGTALSQAPTQPTREAANPGSAAEGSAAVRVGGSVVGKPPLLAAGVRFVLLSPIRHEDLRAQRPGLPDPAPHNALLEQYSKAIEALAKERGARFVSLMDLRPLRIRHNESQFHTWTQNGIHLNAPGHNWATLAVATAFEWSPLDRSSSFKGEEVEKWAAWVDALRAAVLRKNAVFFHRFRPENLTYLTGFRKHEQGKNAVEIPEFDALVAAADAEIDRIKRNAKKGTTENTERTEGKTAAGTKTGETADQTSVSSAPSVVKSAVPLPEFTVLDGYQIELWAENPHLEKPTQMNWDAQGRLWVASSNTYPQVDPQDVAISLARQLAAAGAGGKRSVASAEEIAPTTARPGADGAMPSTPLSAGNDKIIILEDTDRDGRADKSTVFADGLLIPTGVVPDLSEGEGRKAKGESAESTPPRDFALRPSPFAFSSCYVAQSTELLHLADTDGDGRADQRRVVFSGFGTEDTHHLIHTLRWGPDGRLYFNQSVYIHSHLETPWGMVRLNAGGVFAYDPRTERVEVFCKGLWNTWGHAWDDWGQSFLTDGAGRDGISWAFPGAVFAPSEGARKTMPSVSPGSYPKFCGLEIVTSPHFPDDWQGNAVTCDFRAHRVVRFAIDDLSGTTENTESTEGKKGAAASVLNSPPTSVPSVPSVVKSAGKSGYVTRELPDLLRTSDASFRPIDVRLGPDGALYIADWSNPVINHGEVDFRDPRRDKERGRIWRITKKDTPVVKWEALVGKKNEELLDALLSKNAWEKEQARRALSAKEHREMREYSESGNIGGMPEGGVYETSLSWRKERIGKSGEADAAALTLATPFTLPDPDIYEELLKTDFVGVRAMLARSIGAWMADKAMTEEALEKSKAEYARADFSNVRPPSTWVGEWTWAIRWNDRLLPALRGFLLDPNSRVRLEAMRALARIPTGRSAELVLDAAFWTGDRGGVSGRVGVPPAGSGILPERTSGRNEASAGRETPNANTASKDRFGGTPKPAGGTPTLPGTPPAFRDDPHYEFAAWQSINDLAKPWTDAIASGAWKADTAEREAQLAWGLKAIDPALAGATLAKLVAEKKIPLDGTGPWFELIGAAGGPAEIQPLWDSLLRSFAGNCCETDETRALEDKVALLEKTEQGDRAMRAVLEAARTRNLRPPERTHLTGVLFHVDHLRAGAIELAGLWKTPDAPEKLPELMGAADLTPELRRTIFRALRAHGSGEARALIENWTAADAPLEGRREAVLTLAAIDFAKAAPLLPAVLAKFPDEAAALPYWRELLAIKGTPDELAKLFATDGWKNVAKPVRAAREAGKPAAKLLAALGPVTAAPRNYKDYANSARTDGDPVKGEMIYRRANLACVTCHAIGGAGGHVGPDMTSIGASAPLDYIIESIFAPAAKVKEGYNAVSVTMLDGLVVSGVQVRETASELVVRDALGKEQSIPKGQIKTKTDIGSIMPAGLVEQLPHREQMDLFHFLGELGKPGPYDASKGNVARVWRLYPGDASPAPDVTANPGFPGYTLVDGRFTKDLLAESAQIAAAGKDTVVAVAQFQSGGKTRLKLTGATKAWIDGQPLALTNGEAAPELATGTHTLAVQLDAKALPEVLRAESPDARFLGN